MPACGRPGGGGRGGAAGQEADAQAEAARGLLAPEQPGGQPGCGGNVAGRDILWEMMGPNQDSAEGFAVPLTDA